MIGRYKGGPTRVGAHTTHNPAQSTEQSVGMHTLLPRYTF